RVTALKVRSILDDVIVVRQFAFSIVLLALIPSPLSRAQNSTVSFRVFTEPGGAKFAVDGDIYISAASFQWPVGSKHYVRFVQDMLPVTPLFFADPTTPTLRAVQFSPDSSSIYAFSGFVDANGLLIPGGDPNQVVTADASVPFLKISVSLS